MNFDIRPFDDTRADAWDAWCARSVNATLLHTRRFLSYHGTRLDDASLMIHHDGQLVAVLPAARHPSEPHTVDSHPGATYGGLVHDGWLTGMRMVGAFGAVLDHYRANGYQRLSYRPVPSSYARVPSQDDRYALFRHGARPTRVDLACTIDLDAQRSLPERRRRGLKKALKHVTIDADTCRLESLWQVVVDNLARKYDARPIHDLDEMKLLFERFPEDIQLRAAMSEAGVEAGIILFNSARVWHAQYIASSERGHAMGALDAVFDAAIRAAKAAGARYFDFGTSNEDGGRILNEGLYRYKSEFGGGGIVHEHHEIDLLTWRSS